MSALSEYRLKVKIKAIEAHIKFLELDLYKAQKLVLRLDEYVDWLKDEPRNSGLARVSYDEIRHWENIEPELAYNHKLRINGIKLEVERYEKQQKKATKVNVKQTNRKNKTSKRIR